MAVVAVVGATCCSDGYHVAAMSLDDGHVEETSHERAVIKRVA